MRKAKTIGICLVCVILFVSGVLLAEWWEKGLVGYMTETSGVWPNAGNDRIVKVNESVPFNGTGTGIGMIEISWKNNETYPCAIFIWDFDSTDGIQVEAVGLFVNHTFTKPGNYTITLIVVALSSRLCGTDTTTITVIE